MTTMVNISMIMHDLYMTMKKTFSIITFMMLYVCAMAQSGVDLLFKCRTVNGQWVKVDSITVENLSVGWTETLFYPDTQYRLNVSVGVQDVGTKDFASLHTISNPFSGSTVINLYMPEPGNVQVKITDVSGRAVITVSKLSLQAGLNPFRVMLRAPGTYLLTACVNGNTLSAKLVNTGNGGKDEIELDGVSVETQHFSSPQIPKSDKGFSTHAFQLGDLMRYVAYANGVPSGDVTQGQSQDETITLVFNALLPTVTTDVVRDIADTMATCGGYVVSDGEATVTVRGVCWSTTSNPTVNDSHTTDGTGIGSFVSSITGLAVDTGYFVRAYATNSAGTGYGENVWFVTRRDGFPCPGTPTVMDYDSNVYNTVKIGNQCWMKENLRTTHYSNGDSITVDSNSHYYDYSTSGFALAERGYLYNWFAVMNGGEGSYIPNFVQGICPIGWHVPSDQEWEWLENYVGGQSQYVCGSNSAYIGKALADTAGWSSSPTACTPGNNPTTNNTTGFSAFPAGWWTVNHGFMLSGAKAYFWSSTDYYVNYANYAWCRGISNMGKDTLRALYKIDYGLSVRCLRD